MKKKIKDLTISDMLKYCYNNKECKECIFSNVEDECEVEFIRLHSDDYLDQEFEVEPRNSLEALDNLVHCKSETKCKECHHKNVCTLERDYNIIKSDLETFNNENKVLKFENKVLTEGLQELDQDIKDVMSDYQDAAKRMFKYVEAINEILDYLKSHDVSIDFLSDIENIVARAGYYD